MKLLRFLPLMIIALLAGLTSCNEELDFTGTSVQSPVIYCLLNANDSVHYVKITRTFSGANNAQEVAQIADSSYFNTVEVKIQEVIANQVTRTWILDDTLITTKDPGAFYAPDQRLYYFKTTPGAPLASNATYKFTAKVNNGEFTVTGETAMVTGVNITNPTSLGAYGFMTTSNGQLIYSNQSIKVTNGNARIIDARLTVYFNEYFNGNPIEKSFVWKIGELNGDEIQGTYSTFLANGQTFFTLIKQNITDDPTITRRELTRMNLAVTGGSDELSKYILVNQPSSSLAQNKPSYTNLTCSDGRPAIGIFSSRNAVYQEKIKWINTPPYARAIDKNSTIELCTGPITGGYLFCSDHPNDIAAGESYICQ